jgi:hypothetical protein
VRKAKASLVENRASGQAVYRPHLMCLMCHYGLGDLRTARCGQSHEIR